MQSQASRGLGVAVERQFRAIVSDMTESKRMAIALHVRETSLWLLGALALLALLYLGQPLLVPVAFAILIWALLNALADLLVRARLPRWGAWTVSLSLVSLAMYLVILIVGNETRGLAQQAPVYVTKVEQLVTSILSPMHLGFNVTDLFSRADAAGIVTSALASVGTSIFGIVQVLIYVGFLLAEQKHLAAKFGQLITDEVRHSESQQVVRAIAHQVQSYVGVCTVLSAVMAGVTYVLLLALGVGFAGFWALVMFILTYIPTIGALGVVFPAVMAFIQFGTWDDPIAIILILGLVHFLLMNVAEMWILGQTLNLSPFVIVLALTFWGLVWGVAGLFLAVPVTGAIAIVCGHIEGLKWVTILLAAPPPHVRRKHAHASRIGAPIN